MRGFISGIIEKAAQSKPADTYRSSRIGASVIDSKCEAFLALTLRGFPDNKVEPRIKRIFRDGHSYERTILKDLHAAGITVYEKDPMTGKQYMWSDLDGHFVYYADGIIEMSGRSALLEIKSMNSENFEKFKDKGVFVSHPKYYSQLQTGMGLSNFESAIIIAYNKDNSDYWDEVVKADPVSFAALKHRATRAVVGDKKRISTDAHNWLCRFCNKSDSCWGFVEPEKDIRTCANSYMTKDGWKCTKGCSGTVCTQWEKFKPEPAV